MDTMYDNGSGMLTINDRNIKFQRLVSMNTRQHYKYCRALNQILRYYNNAKSVITEIHCDGQYRGMMDKVKNDLDVKMKFANTQRSDHVPEADRNNQTIKEQIRAAYQHLPYEAIPQIMIVIWPWTK